MRMKMRTIMEHSVNPDNQHLALQFLAKPSSRKSINITINGFYARNFPGQ